MEFTFFATLYNQDFNYATFQGALLLIILSRPGAEIKGINKMIAYMEGRLAEAWSRSCLLVTNSGVGYEIILPAHTWSALPPSGERIAFFISHSIREDAQELFGFETFAERQTFNVLTGISKVGARTALAILSLFRPAELRQAVLEDNLPALVRVPGIGQKTAQHIFLELKYKLASHELKTPLEGAELRPQGVYGDTLAALLNLGYHEEECAPHIRHVLEAEPDLDVGSTIRLALKALSKGKL